MPPYEIQWKTLLRGNIMRSTLTSRFAIAFPALILGTLTALPAAHSQSAQEFWRNEYRRQHGGEGYETAPRGDRGYERGYDNGYGTWGSPARGYEARAYAPETEPPAARYSKPPRVEISSPQYYDYAPDLLRPVTFDELCRTKVAANDAAGTIPGAAPATPPSMLPSAIPTAPGLAADSFANACSLSPDITFSALPEVSRALTKYYLTHQRFIWSTQGTVSARAREAMDALAASDQFGLLPADYKVTPPSQAGDPSLRLKDLVRFDLQLSAKVLTYVIDATRGRVDANRISGYHDIVSKKPDLVAALGEVAQSDDVDAYLAGRNPGNPPFRAMVAVLRRLRANEPREPITIAEGTTIYPGESSPQFINVMAALRRRASPELKRQYANIFAGSTPDIYRGKVVDLVRDFQRENNLPSDGIVGPNTIAAMTADTSANKIEKLRLAMERMRWLPRKLGNEYVLLNEPAFEVTYVATHGKRLTMPVIIGTKSRQTYFFTDTIEAVEYNPYWDVPRSIVINEMLPHLYRDPSYLDREGYEVTDVRGRRVSSASVDWARYARNKVSVDVRQPPGPRNALGRLKIKFPNKHAIYMHDTPSRNLFANAQRAFSHGCVRLKHPRVMAAALLDGPVGYVGRRLAERDNKVEPTTLNIPVYLAYFTAWPDSEGTMHYYKDIYDRDQHLATALKKTEQARIAGN